MVPLSVRERLVAETALRIKAHRERTIAELLSVEAPPASKYQLLWAGHLHDHSGYARANREILFRLAHRFRVGIHQDETSPGRRLVDGYTARRLEVHLKTRVSPDAPLLRFYTPVKEREKRHRIIFTMMETQAVHPDMVRTINQFYDQVWTPSAWNMSTFSAGGVKLPIHVVPLGVDVSIYRPLKKCPRPECELLTTSRAGMRACPEGFSFFSLFQPTFRKGADILVAAFEKAFSRKKDVNLILSIGANAEQRELFNLLVPRIKALKSRIWLLTGPFPDEMMPHIYGAFDAYASASRGEGQNLPLIEAAACGLPVIAPLTTAHLDFLNDGNAFVFKPDGFKPVKGASRFTPWYDGMPFAWYGHKAITSLADLMRAVRSGGGSVRSRTLMLSSFVRTKLSWDKSASIASDLLYNII